MGTRADFYVGTGINAKWMGSIGLDGYPEGIQPEKANFNQGEHLLESKTEEEFLQRLAIFFEKRNDVTRVTQGWPWPWETSHTTDYAYAFDKDHVNIYHFGSGPISYNDYLSYQEAKSQKKLPQGEQDLFNIKKAKFPNMKNVQNVTLGNRSGLLVVTSNIQDAQDNEIEKPSTKQAIKYLIDSSEMSIRMLRTEIKLRQESQDPKLMEYIPSLESAIAVIQLNIIKAKGVL